MKKLLIFAFSLLSLALYAQNEQTIKAIHSEINEINSLELKKICVSSEDECSIIEYILFVDNSMNIRKIQHSYTEGCAVEDGFDYTEYFNENGHLIFHFFTSLSTNDSIGGYFRGSFYYRKGKLIKKDVLNKYYPDDEGEAEMTDTVLKHFPIVYSNQNRYQYCLHKTTQEANNYFMVFKDRGSTIKKDELLIINNNNVVLRESPNLSSKVLKKLAAYTHVFFIEKGASQSIGQWGKNNWYKVKFIHDQPQPIVGWVFGAFIDKPIRN